MRRFLLLFLFSLVCFTATSCGYTTSSTITNKYRTIYVERFENKVKFTSEASRRNLYFPLLEVDARNAIIDRYQFDGNLRIAEESGADLILRGSLNRYSRSPLRFTNGDDVEEYRVYIHVALQLYDRKKDEIVWEEPGFVGEATYFVTGSEATSEESAVDEAVLDLARRIVERTVEDW